MGRTLLMGKSCGECFKYESKKLFTNYNLFSTLDY